MRYHKLGSDGPEISVLGLGGNNFGTRLDAARTSRVVHAALACGITLFDTADVYADGDSERLLGRALRDRRGTALIATKFGWPDGAELDGIRGRRDYIVRSVQASLDRLGTDYIDLLQLHTPDPLTPIEDTLQVFDDLVRAGTVRYVGSSNFAAWQIIDADWTARTAGLVRLTSAQNRYSLLERGVEAEVLPACCHVGVGMISYFPLASGLLTGKYLRGAAPSGARLADPRWGQRFLRSDARLKARELDDFARARDIALLDVAIGGLLAREGVACAIAGASTPEQVEANAQSSGWIPRADDLVHLQGIGGLHLQAAL